MIENIKKQLQEVTLPQVEEFLKEKLGHQYEKMLITKDCIEKRHYIFAKVDYEIAHRKMYFSEFPLTSSAERIFHHFENSRKKHNTIPFPTEDILKYTKKKQLIDDQDSVLLSAPFDVENGEVKKKQSYHFMPNYTYRRVCEQCSGYREITCDKCNGERTLVCGKCDGDKKMVCPDCRGSLWVRCGSGFFSSGCGGSGRTYDGKSRCKECAGKGEKRCKECVQGEVKCDRCSGKGKVQCSKCDGSGEINCPVCEANGYFGRIVFVETEIEKKTHSQFIEPMAPQYLKILMKHIDENAPTQIVYRKINTDKIDNYDECGLICTNCFSNKLGLNKAGFPLILQESIYYQIIPCVSIKYKHILTNEEYELSIVNYFDNPEIVNHSNPEKVKISIKSIFKAIKHFLEKLFKTQNYFKRQDQYKEVILFIYLAKADGVIVEEEKEHLIEVINNINDFTNAQKKTLFGLLNSQNLPELTEKELKFNSQEKAKEVLEKLKKLAYADKDASVQEQELLDKISNYNLNNNHL